MDTTREQGGGNPLRDFLDEMVMLEGCPVTREVAIALIHEVDRDYDKTYAASQLPHDPQLDRATAFTHKDAYHHLVNSRCEYERVYPFPNSSDT